METLGQLFERIDRLSDHEHVCVAARLLKEWKQRYRILSAEIDAVDQSTWAFGPHGREPKE